jgi:RNA polymerase sigma-70 factor (ECF subfamily)
MGSLDLAHEEIERLVRASCASHDYQDAASRAFRAYGNDILGFLISHLGSRSAAEDVFSMFSEDLWRGLPGFSFRCSVRAWLYTLARNAATRRGRAPHNRAGRHVDVDASPFLTGLIEEARASTAMHLRSEIKSGVRALRERLAPEDQILLTLYVDRGLSWRELVPVLNDDGMTLEADAVTREAARLRKRFERVKSQLRAWALDEGLRKHEEPDAGDN